MDESLPPSAPLVADGPRLDELLARYIGDADTMTSSEMLELATAILEQSLAKHKYRPAGSPSYLL